MAFRQRLVYFARSLTKDVDTGEDLAQDTLVKALAHWESFEPGTNLYAWLCMIARNQFYSQKRRDWRSQPLDQEVAERTIVDLAINQEEQLGFNQEFAQFAPLIGLLPLDMRDSVIGVHYCGMKYEELADVLNCAVGTVKSRVSRGLEGMRILLDSGREYAVDLSPWEHAAQDVPRNHSYYPIAKAYEDIYAFLKANDKQRKPLKSGKAMKPSELDQLWRDLLASDDLEDYEDLDSLMRQDFEPY